MWKWIPSILASSALACTVDQTSYQEYAERADHIFLGAVVEIRWFDYEQNYRDSLSSAALAEQTGIIEIPSVYEYRAIPSTVFKGPSNPPLLVGGYCHGALVDGANEYIIMAFKEGDEYASVAYHSRSPQFAEIVAYLSKTFVAHKPE